MKTVRLREKTGKDGVLCLRIPLNVPEAEYEAVVVLEAKPALIASEAKGWPPGYFEKTFGSITDETFVRHPQGDYSKPVEFD